MIPVETVYQQVATLSRKDGGGYENSDEFNRSVRLAQTLLYDWYFSRYEQDQRVPDSLRPFLKNSVLNISAGVVAIPDDYRHRVEIQAGYVVNGQNTTYFSCPYLAGNETSASNESYVRRPSVSRRRFFHSIDSEGIKIYPSTFAGVIKLRYLRVPVDAIRGYTINTDDVIEEYASGSSVNFEWEPMDETNLVDILLYLKGIHTRQSELLEWVAQKNKLTHG